MKYEELKAECENLKNKNYKVQCQGFEESFEFMHFEKFYALLDAPKYAVMQAKTNSEMNTVNTQWFLVFERDKKMTVIDISDEETICDEFYELILIWFQGSQKIKIIKPSLKEKIVKMINSAKHYVYNILYSKY